MSTPLIKIYSTEPLYWYDEHAGILFFLAVFVAILLVVAVLATKQFMKDKKKRKHQNDLEAQSLRQHAVVLGGKEGQSESNSHRENEDASGGKEVIGEVVWRSKDRVMGTGIWWSMRGL
ncbi:hypothetical protein FPQ18DRAFT_308099 [Pyronema domesticum]|nr:hypothetical protein FPQ18DRAFT_308099 [Pyronema domesticum]